MKLFNRIAIHVYQQIMYFYESKNQIMSACDPFSVTFEGSAADYLAKAQKAAAKMNGTFAGNETAGIPNGRFHPI